VFLAARVLGRQGVLTSAATAVRTLQPLSGMKLGLI
jgi:hypothetical protein